MSSDLKVTNIKHESSSSNNLVLASDGSATINQISSSTVFPAGGTGNPISVAVIADEKSNGTNGPSLTTGTWANNRDLNTEISDPDNIVSIASNQFTLGAGTYLISWSCPNYETNRHRSRLYDVTADTTLAYGGNEIATASSRSGGSVVTTISSNNVYKVQQRVHSSGGFGGIACSFGVNEIYTIVVIYKLK